MDATKFERIHYRDLEEMEEGSEVFWVRSHMIFEPERTRLPNGKTKKVDRFKGIVEDVFRTKLVKNHHRTVSGWEHCLILDPNSEYPYMDAWSGAAEGSWVYAWGGGNVDMYRRKEVVNGSD